MDCVCVETGEGSMCFETREGWILGEAKVAAQVLEWGWALGV